MATLNSIIQSWGPRTATRLSATSIFFHPQSWALFLLFFVVRGMSFMFTNHPYIQAVIIFVLIMTLGITYFKSQEHAWMIVLTEMFLGGSGHMFEFFGLSIRTILIITFICLWVFFALSNTQYRMQIKLPHRLFKLSVPLFIIVFASALIGLLLRNPAAFVLQDVIPYVFLLLLLPSFHLFKKDFMQHYIIRLMIVFLISSALLAIIAFVLYSTGVQEIHDPLYKWFRDVAAGKITQLSPFFYRIVLPEHLLITPAVLVVLSLLMRDERHHKMWRFLAISGLVILVINFSRSYLLGLAAGMLVLKYTHTFKKWIKEGLWATMVFLVIFFGINLAASLGTDSGFSILANRTASIVNPAIEQSSLTRTQLLEPIFQTIRQHPIIGNGLGATITYIDSKTFSPVRTNQFDWGYLEMLAELGPLGFLYFLTVIGFILFEFIKKINLTPDYHDLKVGLLAGFIALLVINITTPALFHVFGIFYMIFVTSFISKPLAMFDNVTTLLYRVFNKIAHH